MYFIRSSLALPFANPSRILCDCDVFVTFVLLFAYISRTAGSLKVYQCPLAALCYSSHTLSRTLCECDVYRRASFLLWAPVGTSPQMSGASRRAFSFSESYTSYNVGQHGPRFFRDICCACDRSRRHRRHLKVEVLVSHL